MPNAATRLHNFFIGSAAEDNNDHSSNHSPYTTSSSRSSKSRLPSSRNASASNSRQASASNINYPHSAAAMSTSNSSSAPGTSFSSAPSSSRPSLDNILTGTAPAPYTLPALVAYMSLNHCLETLEFTMDASRYTQHFERARRRHAADRTSSESSADFEYICHLWSLLVDTYVVPNGRREVNLPSSVRDGILQATSQLPPGQPPNPSVLDPAVQLTRELISESVLVNFIHAANREAAISATVAAASRQRSAQAPPAQAPAQAPTQTTARQSQGIITPPTTPPQCQIGAPSFRSTNPFSDPSLPVSSQERPHSGSAGPVMPGQTSSAPSITSVPSSPAPNELNSNDVAFPSSSPGTSPAPSSPTLASTSSPASGSSKAAWKKMSRNLGFRR